jgi:hypothetical protein
LAQTHGPLYFRVLGSEVHTTRLAVSSLNNKLYVHRNRERKPMKEKVISKTNTCIQKETILKNTSGEKIDFQLIVQDV